MEELLVRRRTWFAAFGGALAVIGFASFAAFLWQAVHRDGGFAYDLNAYLLAGRAPLYAPMEINDPGAYRYPPTFALLTVPMAPLPEPAATPTLWVARLAALVGSPRLFLEGGVSRAGSDAAERGATRR